MENKKIVLTLAALTLISTNIYANTYWKSLGSDWSLYQNNTKSFVKPTALESICSYSRAEQNMSYGSELYQNRVYSYLLAAYIAGKSIEIVIDDQDQINNNANANCKYF